MAPRMLRNGFPKLVLEAFCALGALESDRIPSNSTNRRNQFDRIDGDGNQFDRIELDNQYRASSIESDRIRPVDKTVPTESIAMETNSIEPN